MTLDNVSTILNDGIQAIIITSLPSVGVGLVVGLIIALFQAVTQIQEQTLTFVPKSNVCFSKNLKNRSSESFTPIIIPDSP